MSIGWITYAGWANWIGEDSVASLRALRLDTSSVEENTAAGVLVGTLLGVTDGSTLSLTDTAGDRFALDGFTIETGATSTNFDVADSHNITVRETLDGYPNSPRDSVISITVTNVFEAASLNALTLDTNEVEDGAAAGTLVGTLQDVTSGSTLSLTDDADGRFVLDGEDIETGATPTDYDAAASHNITVRETLADSANSPRNSVISITVTEVLPAQFDSGDWSVADEERGGTIIITITALPAAGTSAISDLEYQLDGGSWVSLAGTTTGDYPVTGLTDDQEYDVAIRAVSASGNGTASATKAVTPTFDPISLSPTSWYDPSDLTTLFQDAAMTTPVTTDGDVVGAMMDKSGNGNHLVQATTASKPLYKTAAGLHWLLYDNVDDYLEDTFSAGALTANSDIMAGVMQVPVALDTSWLADVHNSGTRFVAVAVNGSGTAPDLGAGNPSYLVNGVAVAGGTAATRDALFDAWGENVTKMVEVDGADLSAWTGFCIDNNTSRNGFSRCYGLAIWPATNDTDKANLRAWMAAKSGVTI